MALYNILSYILRWLMLTLPIKKVKAMVMKTAEEARANFQSSISYIPARYTAGVQKADWLTPAKSDAAERNFADGVGKAVANKTRQRKIAALSNDDWKNAAVQKGAPIIGTRIQNALDKWAAAWSPIYAKVQTSVAALPPSSVDYMANINNRLVPTVKAWKQAAGTL